MPPPDPRREHALKQERRRQIRGFTLLALAILLFSILRAGHVFAPGWWRPW